MVRWWRSLTGFFLGGAVVFSLVACVGRDVGVSGDRRPLFTLSWQSVLGESVPYRVYYGISATPFDGFREVSGPPFTFSDLASDVRYYFSVQVRSPDGEVRWQSETFEGTPIRGIQQRLDLGELRPTSRQKRRATRKAPIKEPTVRARPPAPKSLKSSDPLRDGGAPGAKTPPEAPVDSPRVEPSTGAVTLEWAAPATSADGGPLSDLYGYWIYYGSAKDTPRLRIWTTETRTTVKSLRRGDTYQFHVTAMDLHSNESDPSNSVTATIE